MVAKLQDPQLGLTLLDIASVPIPKQTRTYHPMGNEELVNAALTKFREKHDRRPEAMGFNLSKCRAQMLGVIQFRAKPGENPTTPFTLLLRNSYNKKWSVGVAAGVSVFYCTNMMISGSSFKFFRKHTSGVRTAVDFLFNQVMEDSEARYKRQLQERQQMAQRLITTDGGYGILGQMYGNKILKPRMFSTAMEEWQTPRFEVFENRNLWSLYNAATYGVKAGSPRHVVKHNPLVHEYIVGMLD